MANYPYVSYQQPGYPSMTTSPMYGQTIPQPVSQPVIPAPQTVSASQPGFVCRPVASKSEAQAVPTDFQGNVLVMTDFANGAIYTKALDPATGSAQFVTYQRVTEQPTQTVEPVAAPDYSPILTEFGEQLNRISERMDELFEKLDKKPVTKSSGKVAE